MAFTKTIKCRVMLIDSSSNCEASFTIGPSCRCGGYSAPHNRPLLELAVIASEYGITRMTNYSGDLMTYGCGS